MKASDAENGKVDNPELAVEEQPESEADNPSKKASFEVIVASVFAQTGNVPAALLLHEMSERLPKGNQTRAVIKETLRDAEVGVQAVMAKIREEQDKRIEVVGADALPPDPKEK